MNLDCIDRLLKPIVSAKTPGDLSATMAEAIGILGFSHYAIAHHVDHARLREHAIRLHNYPADWVGFYDERSLATRDPVRRACQVTNVGFRWSSVTSLIRLSTGDMETLGLAQREGIFDGVTIPASVPGEPSGSCSFVSARGQVATDEALAVAQLVGAFAFEGARRFWKAAKEEKANTGLTDRQRDCVLWVARGKSDWEISRILGVSEETVTRHVKTAREKYGVHKRTLLAVRALSDGTLTFDEVMAY